MKMVQFLSRKYRSLRIVLDPKAYKEVQGRRMMTSINGYYPQGKTVEFQNGMFETDDEKLIELLKEHPGFGADFYIPAEGAKPKEEAVKKENAKKEAAFSAANKC